MHTEKFFSTAPDAAHALHNPADYAGREHLLRDAWCEAKRQRGQAITSARRMILGPMAYVMQAAPAAPAAPAHGTPAQAPGPRADTCTDTCTAIYTRAAPKIARSVRRYAPQGDGPTAA